MASGATQPLAPPDDQRRRGARQNGSMNERAML
jgi:hypothetical protein